jgi:hypothetical protein
VDDSFYVGHATSFGAIVPLPKGNAITVTSIPDRAFTWRAGNGWWVQLPSLELSLQPRAASRLRPWPSCFASLRH